MAPGEHLDGDEYCYLTTTGRRSGQPHRIEIWYAAYGDTLYLLSGGGPSSDWVQNLFADPVVLVEVNGDTRHARARVSKEATRQRRLEHSCSPSTHHDTTAT